jgi:hypothetical protein
MNLYRNHFWHLKYLPTMLLYCFVVDLKEVFVKAWVIILPSCFLRIFTILCSVRPWKVFDTKMNMNRRLVQHHTMDQKLYRTNENYVTCILHADIFYDVVCPQARLQSESTAQKDLQDEFPFLSWPVSAATNSYESTLRFTKEPPLPGALRRILYIYISYVRHPARENVVKRTCEFE